MLRYSGEDSTGFGNTVSYDGRILVVGAHAAGPGEVQSFAVDDFPEVFTYDALQGDHDGSGFGWSVDLTESIMIIGAPYLFANASPIAAGGAYVYEMMDGGWVQLGSIIRGDEDLLAVNGDFGFSVAVSESDNGFRRVSVGAPTSRSRDSETGRVNQESGRVYTFEGPLGGKWIRIEDGAPIFGERAGDRFGFSLDMSKDGSTFISGAPGSDLNEDPGYVLAYRYVGTEGAPWEIVFATAGVEANEEFGSSVAMLTDNGDTFAVGAPRFRGGSGRVQVFQLEENGLYKKVGPDIVGDLGDRLGQRGTLSRGKSVEKASVVAGTASGEVKFYDFNEATDTWEEAFETLNAGFDNGVTSLSAAGEDSVFFAVCGAVDNVPVVAIFAADV
jgi:hypothetical protein